MKGLLIVFRISDRLSPGHMIILLLEPNWRFPMSIRNYHLLSPELDKAEVLWEGASEYGQLYPSCWSGSTLELEIRGATCKLIKN